MLTYNDLGPNPPEGWWKNFDWENDTAVLIKVHTELLKQVPRWWEYIDWIQYSWFFPYYQAKLLLLVPRWWEYYNWDFYTYALVKNASYLLAQVPQWWKLTYHLIPETTEVPLHTATIEWRYLC